MNKVIKLNEQDLKRLVKESVEELKYSTYKSAYNKMKELGQSARAAGFNRTFMDKYNDDDTTFNLRTDSVTLGEPRHTVTFNRDGSIDADETASNDNWAGRKHYNDAKLVKDKFPRTDDRKLAKKRGDKIKFYNDEEAVYDKNDFISETVNSVIDRILNEGLFGNDKKYDEKWYDPFSWKSKREKEGMDRTRERKAKIAADRERREQETKLSSYQSERPHRQGEFKTDQAGHTRAYFDDDWAYDSGLREAVDNVFNKFLR